MYSGNRAMREEFDKEIARLSGLMRLVPPRLHQLSGIDPIKAEITADFLAVIKQLNAEHVP